MTLPKQAIDSKCWKLQQLHLFEKEASSTLIQQDGCGKGAFSTTHHQEETAGTSVKEMVSHT